MQGRIAACNVLSDLYAMEVDQIDHMLMILGASRNMVEEHREIVTREMIRGFDDTAKEAGTLVTGGQSIMNPWPIIGGVANAVIDKAHYYPPTRGHVGSYIVLTKPLGT